MTVERLARLVTGRFGGVGTTRGSFVRMHVWAIVFLLAISAIAPKEPARTTRRRFFGPVQPVARSGSDQRGFSPSPFGKKYFHIAWIMGSEGDIVPPRLGVEYLATRVRAALPEIDHRPVVVDMYYFLDMMLGDDYLSLLDALATKPDMVVMSLNALLLFNPRTVHQWKQLDARGALQLADDPRAWPVGAAMFSPSDLMWGLAQSHLGPVAERNYWSKRVHDLVDKLGPLDRSNLAAATAAAKPDRAARVLLEQPEYFFRKPKRPKAQPGRPAPSIPHYVTSAVDEMIREKHPLNSMLLRAIATALKASGVPSYVYLSQVNSSWLSTYPRFSRVIGVIEKELADFKAAFDARTIRFEPTSASRLVPGIEYLPDDAVHMRDPAGFGPYIASELCRLEAQVGKGASCTPAGSGAPR